MFERRRSYEAEQYFKKSKEWAERFLRKVLRSPWAAGITERDIANRVASVRRSLGSCRTHLGVMYVVYTRAQEWDIPLQHSPQIEDW